VGGTCIIPPCSLSKIIMGEVMHVRLVCGRVFGLIDGLLCELELICEVHEEEEQET